MIGKMVDNIWGGEGRTQTVTDKRMTQLRLQALPVMVYSGVLITIINDCIPYINELNQHKRHIVIKELLEK